MQNKLDHRVASAFYGSFLQLNPMQQEVLTPLLEGKNLILCSGTGSGKTEAVLTPLISRYWKESVKNNSTFLLYLVPTQALANDLEKRLYLPLEQLGLTVSIRHGDHDSLKKRLLPHLLITTPESLEVLLLRHDKVHLFYNTQRGFQVSVLLKRIQKHLQTPLQWVALSATTNQLSDIKDFLVGSQQEVELFSYATNRFIDAHIYYLAEMRDFGTLMKRFIQKRRCHCGLALTDRAAKKNSAVTPAHNTRVQKEPVRHA